MKDCLEDGAREVAFVENVHAALGPLTYPELVERAEVGGGGISPHVLREVIWEQVRPWGVALRGRAERRTAPVGR